MLLGTLDWAIVALFFAAILVIGLLASRKAGSSSTEFFLSGRNMPWWLLGVSMVATTFSTDTPNLVTDLVRTHGVCGNWLWWAFLLTGMLTVFVYAKLWRRSKVMTDIEFYEIRYSGKSAAFLRGFRSLYLGVFFNVMIMATVSLAAIKIGGALLNLTPFQTIAVALLITGVYTILGGLRSVLMTDFFLFSFAMFGAIMAAVVAVGLPEVNGLANLFSHPRVVANMHLLPDFNDSTQLLSVLIIPLAVQWWSVWYPGAEPGGGGYLVQRMLSAKDEKNAMGATLLFNIAHYALRPWPWIIVALASLIVFPDLMALAQRFPHINAAIIKNDLAYPAMLTFLPRGLLGIVVASLLAAYMSTMASHLNWGSSYIVNDFYKRFVKPAASEKELVTVGRIATLLLMLLAGAVALLLSNALQAFHILLQIGAGTGLIYILRWFWWRINAFTEITGMIVSFLVALYLEIIHVRLGFAPLPSHINLIIGVGITTAAWLLVTLLTPPAAQDKLRSFYTLVRPGGIGWDAFLRKLEKEGNPVPQKATPGDLPLGLLCMIAGCFAVYGAVFGTGYLLYGKFAAALLSLAVSLVAAVFLVRTWGKLEMK
ncbi:MAG: Na+:solute symporter [candidate division KSB1 bacterium]|nr:Na+:solute symporter [candidate division KSB1 bacterium]MDZ7345918.1 Na+:solute symporter [candidate division KSB1 bacterium]